MSDSTTREPPHTQYLEVPQRLALVRAERERVITALCEGYAADLFDDNELERRMDLAHRATTVADLEALRADLPGPLVLAPASSLVPGNALITTTGPAALPARRQAQNITVVFGTTRRRGSWAPATVITGRSIFGSIELDLRDATLPPGVTLIEVSAIFGNIEIFVPPGLAVETQGTGIFGNFDYLDRAPAVPDPAAPLLRIEGHAIFGNVEVKTRLPGESDWQAWRRRKRELRLARDQ